MQVDGANLSLFYYTEGPANVRDGLHIHLVHTAVDCRHCFYVRVPTVECSADETMRPED